MTILRLICILTGGHRWIIQDDWHDGKVLKQCEVCCVTVYGPGGVK